MVEESEEEEDSEEEEEGEEEEAPPPKKARTPAKAPAKGKAASAPKKVATPKSATKSQTPSAAAPPTPIDWSKDDPALNKEENELRRAAIDVMKSEQPAAAPAAWAAARHGMTICLLATRLHPNPSLNLPRPFPQSAAVDLKEFSLKNLLNNLGRPSRVAVYPRAPPFLLASASQAWQLGR